MLNNMPIIRIEIEGIRQQIAAAMSDYGNEISAAVDKEIARTIAEYPFEERVCEATKNALDRAIGTAVDNYFNYGDGATEVRRMVEAILSNVNKDTQGKQ